MQSFKSREYVRETFAWMHYYWFLTNDGIEFLRTYLNLPSEIVPATLKKNAKGPTRPMGGPPGDHPRGPPWFEGGSRFGDRDGYHAGPRRPPGEFGGDKGGARQTSNHHLGVSRFSTSSHCQSYSRMPEEDSRNVRVSVWWDFENCQLPAGVNVFKITNAITAAVRANGIKGAVQITAFGNVMKLSKAYQEGLSSTGINLTHIPNGGKSSADRSLLVHLMCWVSQNPPPAHLFLISGDRDFAGVLHRLRMNNYNILLASPESAPDALCCAASIMWHWNALVRGENLTGKHYNNPPDGPFFSWYGHDKVTLEDPFAARGQ
ncbi:40S ribosomal protein S10-1 [Quillaja saponaria]|uniref:40S ribosomal protein S10-1 n=1 Tax=Quillaja saponaria TaxID=32244 RepID=A0AAD7KT24_QUISA|nr:40S ribosomal protein S10-1 [Quillaja saponaria]